MGWRKREGEGRHGQRGEKIMHNVWDKQFSSCEDFADQGSR